MSGRSASGASSGCRRAARRCGERQARSVEMRAYLCRSMHCGAALDPGRRGASTRAEGQQAGYAEALARDSRDRRSNGRRARRGGMRNWTKPTRTCLPADLLICHEFRARLEDVRMITVDGDSTDPLLSSRCHILINVSTQSPMPPGVDGRKYSAGRFAPALVGLQYPQWPCITARSSARGRLGSTVSVGRSVRLWPVANRSDGRHVSLSSAWRSIALVPKARGKARGLSLLP